MNIKRYRFWILLTLFSVYFLILVGAWVRSSGSGMGCPDWPKCFGRWVPPTSVTQLPSNYRQIYQHKGYDKLVFNPIKTWTEYANRLLGVVTGIIIVITFGMSVFIKEKYRASFWYSLASLVLVIIQGWLGSKVVALKLTPWIVTLHMSIALAIVTCLIAAYIQTLKKETFVYQSWFYKLLFLFLCLVGLQIVFGTHVREEIDHFSLASLIPRTEWISNLSVLFNIHRFFSWLLLSLSSIFFLITWIIKLPSTIQFLLRFVFFMVISEMIVGICLASYALPAFLQPFHLLSATLIFGMVFFTHYLSFYYKK
jgi:cytochrome c oxidase assembly protein subunit 15